MSETDPTTRLRLCCFRGPLDGLVVNADRPVADLELVRLPVVARPAPYRFYKGASEYVLSVARRDEPRDVEVAYRRHGPRLVYVSG